MGAIVLKNVLQMIDSLEGYELFPLLQLLMQTDLDLEDLYFLLKLGGSFFMFGSSKLWCLVGFSLFWELGFEFNKERFELILMRRIRFF